MALHWVLIQVDTDAIPDNETLQDGVTMMLPEGFDLYDVCLDPEAVGGLVCKGTTDVSEANR